MRICVMEPGGTAAAPMAAQYSSEHRRSDK